MTYGSSAPAFTQTNNAPPGVTVAGSVSCATVNGGTAIGSSLAAGSYPIDGSSCSGLPAPAGYTLSYAGTFTVNQAQQSVGFTALATWMAGRTATLTAVGGGSANPVTFSVDASSGTGVCSVSGSTVSYPAVGTCVIDAGRAGDVDYLAALQVSQTITVTPAPLQVTSASPPGATLGSGYDTTLAATGGSGPYAWSVTRGSLQPRLSLNTATGPSQVRLWRRARSRSPRRPPTPATRRRPRLRSCPSIQAGVAPPGTTITGTHSGPLTIGPGVTSINGATLTGPVKITAGA